MEILCGVQKLRLWRGVMACALMAGVGLGCGVGVGAGRGGAPDKRLRNATDSFREMMHEPDKGIPLDLYEKARCVVIIPER